MNEDALLVQTRLSELRDMFEDVIRKASLTKPNLPEVIDIDEVCRITGYKKSTIYDFTHKHIIPCHKPAHGGRHLSFKRSEVVAFMQRTRINTREEAFKQHCQGIKDKQVEIEFLRRNLREAKTFLKLLQLIHSLLLIQADKNEEA